MAWAIARWHGRSGGTLHPEGFSLRARVSTHVACRLEVNRFCFWMESRGNWGYTIATVLFDQY